MAGTSSPITGVPLPVTTNTDQVPADLMTAFTAAEKLFLGRFANTADRDAKITAPQGGQVAWLISPGKFTYYDATAAAWADLVNPTAWDTWTPTLQSTGGTAFNLGTGATQIGRYRLSGKGVQFQCTWNFGSSVSGPGGQLVFLLPPGLAGANVTGLQQTGSCSLYVPNLAGTSVGPNFQGFWTITPGGTYAQPHFPLSSTTSSMDFFRDTTDGTSAGTGVPNITGTAFNYPIQVNGTLVASGLYQIA